MLTGPPASDPLTVVQRLLAIQGQDPRGARLAIRARSRGLTAATVDRALSEERSLLITWLNRGTLHLVRSEDYPWLHALTAPRQLTGTARRLSEEGVTGAGAERGVATIERSLGEEGPLSRAQLAERLRKAGIPIEGQALIHLLILASLRGAIVRGPMVAGEHAYALVCDWLGKPAKVDRERALAELARRYLAGHGPAGERDLARWSGLSLGDARAGLQAIARDLVERPDGLLDLADARRTTRLAPARLLGAFDPILLGWRSREPVLGEHQRVITVNGLFRPFALVRGRAAGTWRLLRGDVVLEPFATISERDSKALANDAREVTRFLAAERSR